ncbi:uncharacterized protein JCM15063_005325 [Sporobolomyces koalae]|uniref:uncharacterized protein n=1 Tax=Sporobolomyces koalae TaxID=500713 RepID=UPI00316D3D6A
MADDFVLNFDAPSSTNAGPARQPRQKGGRWTDRAKEKRFNKLKLEKPISTDGSPRAKPKQDSTDKPRESGAGGARGGSKPKANAGTAAPANGGAGGSRRLEQAVGPSGKKQFISSLFTAEGLPVAASASETPIVPAKPSNAPMTHTSTTPNDDNEDDEEEDPAPELTKLGLMKELVQALSNKLGITGPTACQAGAIPRLVQTTSATRHSKSKDVFEHDAILRAQTGSGKTLTFLLPMLQDLLTLPAHLLVPPTSTTASSSNSTSSANPDRSIGTLSIILAPTRELASQIHTVLSSLLSSMPYSSKYSISPRALTACLLVGGANRTHEKRRLRKGCPIVVATPGRLLDHLKTTESFRLAGQAVKVKSLAPRGRDNANNAPLGTRRGANGSAAGAGGQNHKETLGLRWLIVDECDRLMDLGFEEQMRGILEDLESRSPSTTTDASMNGRKRRRTILCSATASEGVDRLAGLIMGEEGKTPAIVGAREDLKVREPVRRDLTTITAATDKGKKRAAQDDEDEDDTNADEDANHDDSERVEGEPSHQVVLPSGFTPPSQLLHHYLVVPPKLRFVSLIALLRKLLVKNKATGGVAGSGMKVLVFMSCTDAVDFWWKAIGGMKLGRDEDVEEQEMEEEDDDEEDAEDGEGKTKKQKKKSLASLHPLLPAVPVYRLHGSLPLQTRLASLNAFSTKYTIEDGKRQGQDTQDAVLLCTSVAARGLDVKNVGCVVQVDAPTEGGITEYIHRVGRTARAGAQGSAYSFLLPSETPYAQMLEDGINTTSAAAGSESNKKKTRLREVGVEEVLRDGYGGGKDTREFETRATDVQMGFERWANATEDNSNLARKAFQAHIRAYATHPSAEKHIFNTKALHLGHLAKSFGMREAPGHGPAGGSSSKKGGRDSKRVKTNNNSSGAKGGADAGSGTFETGWKRKQMDAEARMKKLMRGPKGNGGGEFQIAGEDVLGALRKGK